MVGKLSPGCKICGEGDWSCLFINGKCNCRCFYCPTVQNDLSVPTTNRVPFTKSSDYAAYADRFGFRGISISGGEPLMTFDRTLGYINAVRKKTDAPYHIWMYTNGTLLTRDHIRALKDAGLDEIRFDISAADYSLSKIEMAAGSIPNITVEIPAIPEDENRLRALLPVMKNSGINYLNLHQLRLTPFNFEHLRKRPYTFLHGEKVTVLESELLALSLMQTAIENDWDVNINYCSFVYKHRFQRAATRRRNAVFIMKGFESITENGFIRTLSLTGPAENIMRNVDKWKEQGVDTDKFSLTGKKDRLSFHESLWADVNFNGLFLTVSYSEAILSPAISYRYVFKEIPISPGKKIVVEKRSHISDISLSEANRNVFEKQIIFRHQQKGAQDEPLNEEIAGFEMIHPGLQDYY